MTYWIEAIGWVGAALTLTAYSSRTMIPLRLAAVCANACFIGYGALSGIYPTLALHAALLPLNLYRLREIRALRARAVKRDGDFDWIAEIAPAQTLARGTQVFAAGDSADMIYYIKAGRVRLPEVGRMLEAGTIFGEMAFFTTARRRSASALCETDCTLVALDETRFVAAFNQDPAFGMALMRLMAERLVTTPAHARPERSAQPHATSEGHANHP